MTLKRHLEYVQFQGISWMSRIIQGFTRDSDSHSAVIDRQAPTEKILIEQWPHKGGATAWMGYNTFENGHTPGTPYYIWSLAVSPQDYDFVMDYYRRSAEEKKPYDWAGIIAFALKGEGSADKTFCSEEMVTPLTLRLKNWEWVKPVVVHPGYFRNLLIAAGATHTGPFYVD